MHTRSIWNIYSGNTDFPRLDRDENTDIVIIGGGITGITAAHELSKTGCNSILLEKEKIGGGTSSHSTGNLYFMIDKLLHVLLEKYSKEVVGKVVQSRKNALDEIRENIDKYRISCDYGKRTWHLYSESPEDDVTIENELEAAMSLGIEAVSQDTSSIPFSVSKCMKIEGQAQINPMKYVQGLARAVKTSSCRIYENTPVVEIEKVEDRFLVHTESNKIHCNKVIHATHTPKGVKFLQTLLGPYREYGIACKLSSDLDKKGIFWGYHNKEKFSTRLYEENGEQFLIVVGKPHKVGQAESNVDHINELELFANKHFSVSEVIYRWGGQHYRPADQLPYIGELNENEYVATGFSTDGLIYGTLSGMMIADQIAGKENEFTEVYDPKRNQPLKSMKEFAKENLDVAKQLLDLIPSFKDEDYEHIPAGEGDVIEKNGHKLAVYRNEDGRLQVLSAQCTHLHCIVSWNNAEKSWDCPCHGSRFKTDGSVLEGPALKAMAKTNYK